MTQCKTYKVLIIETLKQIEEVEAVSPNDAIRKVQELYYQSEIVLDWQNLSQTEFCLTDKT